MSRTRFDRRAARRAHHVLERSAGDTTKGPDKQLHEATRQLRRVVPFDGCFVAAVDPATMLCMRRGLVSNLDPSMCRQWWDNEYLVPDYNKYADVARGAQPVATLDRATGGQPARSERYRTILKPMGYQQELRMVFPTAGSVWGIACLLRDGGAFEFSADEAAFAARAASTIAVALRRAVMQDSERPGDDHTETPLVLFDPEGRAVTATPAGLALIQDVTGMECELGDHSAPMPFEVQQILARARAVSSGGAVGRARTRLRAPSGDWLVLEASCLRDRHGRVEHTALTSRRLDGSDIAPLLAAAHDLSARERQIVQLVAQGATTSEMAAQLFISVHTVRDHLKAIFEKTGVASRNQLVATIFATHYFADLHAGITHPDDDELVPEGA